MLEYIFKTVLITSFIGTLPALLFALVKPITKKCFSSGWHYYVWIVVLISMILPFRFVMPENMDAVPSVFITEPANTEQNTYHVYAPDEAFVHGEVSGPETMQNNVASVFAFIKSFAESKINFLSIMWLLGMSILFLSKIIGYMMFLVSLRKNSDVISCPEIKRFTDRKIIVRTSDNIFSPLMLGLIKPTLLLPKTAMTKEQLDNVLAHEMTHFKRKDILYKWFACIVKCIHWFNPAIYYVSRQINIECEISCDLAVVKEMSKEQEISYINTILTLLAAKNSKIATITTGMVSDTKSLKRRFTMIKNKFNISRKAVVISVILALVVLGGTVFASGTLNGTLLDEPEDEVVQSTNDESTLKVKSDDNSTITYNAENGEILSVVSEPKLVSDQKEADNSVSTGSKRETNTAITKTETEFNANKSSDIVLKEITTNESLVSPCEGQISMTFGKREHPITKEVREHNGIDIKAPEGTDVVSSITGTVTDVGFDADKGNYIVVEKDNIKTIYSQLATTNVKKGDSITARQSIGTVGKTGKSTGAHLHFEVMIDGEYYDPKSLIH